MNDELKKAIKLIKAGSEITGAAVGGALSGILSGPIGGAAGSVLGYVLTKTIGDIACRVLSKRERAKIGAASYYAIEAIKKRVDEGAPPRKEWFASTKKQTSTAEELFENILLVGKSEHEEKKLKLLGILFANIAFHPFMSKEDANLQIRRVEELSYRQICMLAAIAHRDHGDTDQFSDLKAGEALNIIHKNKQDARDAMTLLQEAFEMYLKALIEFYSEGRYLEPTSWKKLVPAEFQLSIEGTALLQLIDWIDSIEKEDWYKVAQLLKYRIPKDPRAIDLRSD